MRSYWTLEFSEHYVLELGRFRDWKLAKLVEMFKQVLLLRSGGI
ncbi:MAG: hypothetical protein ACTS4U_00940 [Candidatus Hodgkinia cicadicola]